MNCMFVNDIVFINFSLMTLIVHSCKNKFVNEEKYIFVDDIVFI